MGKTWEAQKTEVYEVRTMRLIDADKLALKLRYMGYMDEHEEVQEVIDEAPTIDAVERIEYEKIKDLAEQYKFEYECLFEDYKDIINNVLPNRVEVVRCKDCTQFRIKGKDYGCCLEGCGTVMVYGYCAYGERREEWQED